MNYDITPIKNYILYLKKEAGLFVTLHPLVSEGIISESKLNTFNIHEPPYCLYVKTDKEAQKRCIEKQTAVLEKSKDGRFVGVCHAGVQEFVYPIQTAEKTVGFICVSGYACPLSQSYLNAMQKKYGFPADGLAATYSTLKKDMPDLKAVDTLIEPLCQMLELAYRKSDEQPNSDSFVSRVIAYIKKYYTTPITSQTLCAEFYCSRSHLSHAFNRETGVGLKEYLTDLRINAAKSLLKNSDLTVTEISLSVGFSDGNYFSGVFKKRTGLSPIAYKKKHGNA